MHYREISFLTKIRVWLAIATGNKILSAKKADKLTLIHEKAGETELAIKNYKDTVYLIKRALRYGLRETTIQKHYLNDFIISELRKKGYKIKEKEGHVEVSW